MAIIEQDLQTGDSCFWHPRRNPQEDAPNFPTEASSLLGISQLGEMHQKVIKYESVGADRICVSICSVGIDAKGEVIAGSVVEIEEPYILVGQEINAANITVGNRHLVFIAD